MNETDKILFDLGFYDSDPNKKKQIQGYVDEATEFMLDAGVPKDKITTQRAYAVKSIWASGRVRGEPNDIVQRDGMIVNLIAQLRR